MKNKKKFLILSIITIFLLIITCFLSHFIFKNYQIKQNFENSIINFSKNNENTIFKINNVVFFSSSDAKNKSAASSNFTLENLYQFTDIALFLSSNNNEYTLENTLKDVWIEDIKFTTTPSLGEQALYFKSLNNFAKSTLEENNIILDKLQFQISSEDEISLDSPILYNNLANPITLSYVNSNIKSDYTFTDTSTPITYDGSLLKKCNVSLDALKCSVSFNIFIVNNLDQEFKCLVNLDIPLNDNEHSIYDGKFLLKKDTNFEFYRYK